jgi:hypothetical protein
MPGIPAEMATEMRIPRSPSGGILVAGLGLFLSTGAFRAEGPSAQFLGGALRRIGQPAVMGPLLAGPSLGPSVLGAILAGGAARPLPGEPTAEVHARRRLAARRTDAVAAHWHGNHRQLVRKVGRAKENSQKRLQLWGILRFATETSLASGSQLVEIERTHTWRLGDPAIGALRQAVMTAISGRW